MDHGAFVSNINEDTRTILNQLGGEGNVEDIE